MPTSKSTAPGVENEKVIAMLSYFIFFLPLLVAKESKFALYHANQAFNLFLLFVAVSVIGTILPVIGWIIIAPLGTVFCLVLMVMGIINSLNGEEKELPVIGKYKILKLQ